MIINTMVPKKRKNQIADKICRAILRSSPVLVWSRHNEISMVGGLRMGMSFYA